MSASVFGLEFEQIWPLIDIDRNLTKYCRKHLEQCLKIEKPVATEVNIREFMEKSEDFNLDIQFPINTCRVNSQPKERIPFIEKQIVSAYPLIHEKVLFLIIDFLDHKTKYGSSKERGLYKNMTIIEFIQRLLTKRCISFVGDNDEYLLITGSMGRGSQYTKIGTKKEQEPLILKNVLSYDEIKISAFLSISSHTDFINEGDRSNNGKVIADITKIEREGLVIGIIGARFEQKELMEFQDIVISQNQNVPENGYGEKCFEPVQKYKSLVELLNPWKKFNYLTRLRDYRRIWNKFYQEYDQLFSEVVRDYQRFDNSLNPLYTFDNVMMKKRYALAFDLLLLESDSRAKAAEKLAYIHVVGFGLGVWRAAMQQEKIFMETFYQRLKYLLPFLNNIGVVHFAWFTLNEWGDLKDNGFLKSDYHPRSGILTLISRRSPNRKLRSPEYDNMLLIVSYACNPNALPGNEFWTSSLQTSNDPSTACSTLITELHNPHINTEYVNGKNLHIASSKLGVLHVKDYVQKILEIERNELNKSGIKQWLYTKLNVLK